jgi:dienelactone hydrolase
VTRREWLAVGAIALVMAATPLPAMAVSYDEEPPTATTPAATAVPAATASPSASAASSIALVPFEDTMFDIASVAPDGWAQIAAGVRARGTPPEDPTLIVFQTAPVGSSDLWKALLPQLFLTEVPAATDARRTDGFDWTIHDFEVAVGDDTVATSVALAEADGSTSIVILQARPQEAATLREAVLLPALDAFELVGPKPTPDPATLGYQVEDVRFAGGSDGVELAGTLTLPDAPGPHPVIVLMSGSGPQDRNESTRPAARIEPFALIADALTRAGIGVLRYDDRGVAESSGDYASATIADLTSDGRAALDYLETRSDVDGGRLGVLGHSEGGLYAATLGADDPRVAFVVVLAPPAIDGATLLVEQNAAIARASGLPQAEIEANIEVFTRLCPAAVARDQDSLESIVREASEAYWDRQTESDRTVLGDRDVFVDRQVAGQLPSLVTETFRGICASDPTADWSRVTVPLLALFGARDVQVLADSNAAGLRAALERAGNDDATIVTIANANHLFQSAETGAPREYSTLADTFSPDVLPTIVDWLTARVLAGGAEGPSPTSGP